MQVLLNGASHTEMTQKTPSNGQWKKLVLERVRWNCLQKAAVGPEHPASLDGREAQSNCCIGVRYKTMEESERGIHSLSRKEIL